MNGSVVIVGGGVMGAATACFLARDHGVKVTVLERDLSYARASSSLSASSIRQQFSQPVNIALSAWSLAFLRRVGEELAKNDTTNSGAEPLRPQIGLVEPGYLYLASSADTGADTTLRKLHALQSGCGADVALLDSSTLAQRFPWLNCSDLALASLGLSGEGWFDGPALAAAFRHKAKACGVHFVDADVTRFVATGSRVHSVGCANGRVFVGDAVVLCAGAWSGALSHFLSADFVLPVTPKKRDVFVFDSPVVLPACPLVIDPSGLWFRPEGRSYLCGAPPRGGEEADPDEPPLTDIDHAMFDEMLWPLLAYRVPGFEALRLRSAWAGYYEMNAFDHNGLAGALPGWNNVFTACGFSGHGMQQAPAVGCALAALIAGARCDAPALDALSPHRLLTGQRLVEANII